MRSEHGSRNAEGALHELWAAAAIRERFRAGELLDRWLNTHQDADAAAQQDAVLTIMDIQERARPALAEDGQAALRLRTEERFRVLRRVGVAGAQQGLNTLLAEERTRVEQLLGELLARRPISIDEHDRGELMALAEAVEYANAAGAKHDYELRQLREQIKQLDLLMMLGGPDVHRFIGRRAQLEELHARWLKNAGPVLIQGPGGVGKSLLVCRFVSELLLSGRDVDRPGYVFHFEFDRRDLQNFGRDERSASEALTRELIRQARQWLPANEIEELLEGREAGHGSYMLESNSFSRSSRQYVSDRDLAAELAQRLRDRLMEANPGAFLAKRAPQVLLIFDSLEQVLAFNDDAVNGIFSIQHALHRGGLESFSILISRSFALPDMDWSHYPKLDLKQFTDGEAHAYLMPEAARRGVVLDEQIAARAIATVGRSPLALRLAISLISKDTKAFDPRRWVIDLRDNPERIQAILYDRILARIRDKELAKIARPGLLVRRLSVEVIENVLAGPCQLDLGLCTAQDLIRRGRREGQLFVENPLDSGALWHRSDVRALMLPDLDLTVDGGVAREINLRAVAYYAARAAGDDLSRTEELYHRLRLGQLSEQLDERWTQTAGGSLWSALPELPPQARAYVRRRLGAASLTGVLGKGGDIDADSARELREVVRRELQGLADGADPMATLTRYDVDHIEGPLGDLYAEALLARGDIEKLLKEAWRPDSSLDGPPSVSGAICVTVAGVLEGLGQIDAAFSQWQTAIELVPAESEQDIYVALTARMGALRTERKLDEVRRYPGFADRRAAGHDEARPLVGMVSNSLLHRAVTCREVVAEMIEPCSSGNDDAMLLTLLSDLIYRGQAFPSAIEDRERAVAIGRRLGVDVRSLRELAGQSSKLVYGEPADRARMIEIIRDEVEWTLRRAVALRSDGSAIDAASPI